MRYLLAILLALMVLGTAFGSTCTWKVATVHGLNQFTISNGGTQLLYHVQPRNTMGWYWINNNGWPPGTLATGGYGPNGWRDGSKTFAMTDVAYGKPLNSLKLVFSYYMPEGTTVWNYPAINFFITDGCGRYGIWAPMSGGVQYFSTVRNGDWMTMTLDLTNPALVDDLGGFAIYEHNGFTNDFSQPFTLMQWGGIKNYKIAGFSDYQRSPAMGWSTWGSAWETLNNAWCPYVIRKSTATGTAPQINNVTLPGGQPAVEFVISETGMKAAWGTWALDGKKVRDIAGYIERYDDPSRFTPGSGPAVAPYFNVWVTDGAGRFAVIANEPSNPEWTNYPGRSRNFGWDFLKTKTVKVYETSDKSWFPNNGVGLTFNDLANYTILAPTPDQLAAGWPGLGTGAPRELGTNKAYGFNWVFGDTLSNYVSGAPGYIVANPAVIEGGPQFNKYGITLNWGDTVCSGNPSPYATQQRLIKDVVLTVDGTDYYAVFESDQSGPNCLSLVPTEDSIYVKPGETVTVDMNVANLTQMVKACQAMLGYDSTYLTVTGVAPGGGGVWDDLIYATWATPGEIDTAVGVYSGSSTGTDEDGKVAILTLIAGSNEGLTRVVFRPDAVPDPGLIESTFLSDLAGNPIWPSKIESREVCIDGTAPSVSFTATQGGTNVKTGSPSATTPVTIQGSVLITVTASDALAGLADANPVCVTVDGVTTGPVTGGGGTYTCTATVDSATGNGSHQITVTATDKAGNVQTVSDWIYVNKNQVTGTVTLQGYAGGTRDVTFSINGGSLITKSLSFSGDTASYILTNLPDTVTSLSAKAAWNLRKRASDPVNLLDSNGQAAINFLLPAGDINGTNSVNILDYSIMKASWLGSNPVADIDGNGIVNIGDYDLMKLNWFKLGDPL